MNDGWRMYRRTLDEESAALWRAQGIATETAVLATWIRQEARREGLQVHPTASVSISRIYDGDEPIGVCVGIPVRAELDPRVPDPDPLYVAGAELDDHGSGPPVVGVALLLGLAVLVAAVAIAWRAWA